MIRETTTKRIVDLTQDWDLCFLPGQKVDMSMLFERAGQQTSICPSCQNICVEAQNTDLNIECPFRGLNFRKIVGPEEAAPLLEIQNALSSLLLVSQPLRTNVGDSWCNPADGNDADIRSFRRVCIMKDLPSVGIDRGRYSNIRNLDETYDDVLDILDCMKSNYLCTEPPAKPVYSHLHRHDRQQKKSLSYVAKPWVFPRFAAPRTKNQPVYKQKRGFCRNNRHRHITSITYHNCLKLKLMILL